MTRVITAVDGQPAQLPRDIAEGLISVTTKDGMLDKNVDYQAGDRVSVVCGPFSGWLAQVLSAEDAGRIQLLVDVMGCTTTVSIAGHDLEKRG